MMNIEQALKLHHDLAAIAPIRGSLSQHVTTLRWLAYNKADHELTFTSRISPSEIVDATKKKSFLQGYGCIEIVIEVQVGGYQLNGQPRTQTEVTVDVLNQLDGGTAKERWQTNGEHGAHTLADDAVIPLVRKLLGLPSLEELGMAPDENP